MKLALIISICINILIIAANGVWWLSKWHADNNQITYTEPIQKTGHIVRKEGAFYIYSTAPPRELRER